MKSDATPAGGSGDTEARPGPRRCVPCADSRPGPSDDLHARLKAPHCLASRLLAPLPVMLALAVIACGVLVFVLARQGDDRHEARRREFLLSAVEEFRTAFTDFTRRRATDVATPSMFKDAMAFGRSDVSLAPSGSTRYRHDHAYLVDAEGRLLASYPDGEDRVPLAVRRLLADLRAEGGARQYSATSGADVTGSVDRPGLSDYVAVDEEPLLAAVVVARNPLVMAGDETTGPVLVMLTRLDKRLVERFEQGSGVEGLRIDSNLDDRERNGQALLDRYGRIVGWLTWNADRSMTRAVIPLLLLLGAVALCLLGLAVLLVRLARRSTRDIAEAVQETRALAYRDAITGLPNRRRMLEFLDHALANRRPDAVVDFVYIDPNGFKEINDALGHHGGDQLLAAIGERLQEVTPPSGLVGRFGGDEFALVMVSDDPNAGLCAAKAVSNAVARPFWMNGQVIEVAASIGLVQSPRDGSNWDKITRRADLALRAAKKLGHGQTLAFEPAMEIELEDRRFLKQELRRALGDGALELHYQPIVVADRTRICGVEALVRWDHPTRGHIPPNVFVPMAEQTGLMEALGEFVLRKALADAMRWRNLHISVNISPVQIRNRGFVDLVAAVMKETGIAPARVVLEVTEGVLIDDPDEGQKQLERLRALGLRIALDDFGVGYSSLSYLQRFAFDKLKIDKEFVAPLGRSGNGAVIIQSIVGLGRALGLSVLAEGVETEEQRVLLRLAGCDEMQGYLFAKPAPRETVDELVANAETRGIVGRAAPRALEASFG